MDKTEEELEVETVQHISDVNYLLECTTHLISVRGVTHDNEKLEYSEEDRYINPEFHKMACNGFKDCEWWQKHKKEGHHTPKNLVDLIEMTADGIAACARRSDLKEYRPIDFTKYDLVGMFKDLESMIIKHMKELL
jgi:hypothetical protein